MQLTVTATQGGATANGVSVRGLVLAGAAPASAQTGATATQTGAAAHEAALTTTVTSSRVFMAAVDFANTAFTADANTAIINADVADATNGRRYVRGKANADTGTPGSLTVGFTAPADNGGLAAVEILPAFTFFFNDTTTTGFNSANALNQTSSHSAVFSPLPGCLLVVMVSSNGGAGVTTMSVTDDYGSLTWTELAVSNASGAGYAGVWVAQVPPGAQAVP